MVSLLLSKFPGFDQVVDQRVVGCLVDDILEFVGTIIQRSDVIDSAVANMRQEGTVVVQNHTCHCGTHLLDSHGIHLVEFVVGVRKCLLEHRFVDDAVRSGMVCDVLTECCCSRLARHLSAVVASHAVAHQEDTVVRCDCFELRPQVVLLVIFFPDLREAQGFSDYDIHLFCSF